MGSGGLATTSSLDNVLLIITPENVRFDFRLAGPFPRLIAMLIDYVLIIMVLMLISTLSLAIFGQSIVGFLLIIFFVAQWGYTAMLEALFNGQTAGKRVMRLRVVSTSGHPINVQQAFLRSFLRTADLVPMGLVGAISMVLSPKFQRLGDLAAGTIVIVEGTQGKISPPATVEVKKLKSVLIPVNFKSDAMLTEALTLYMSRREKLPRGRRKEIANKLAKHFIRTWSLPQNTDPDELLCLLYERIITSRPLGEVNVKKSLTEKTKA